MAQSSVTVSFVTDTEDGESGDILTCDLDNEKHIQVYGEEDGDGKSQFMPGETAYIRVFVWPPARSVYHEASDGNLGGAGTGTATIKERIQFQRSKEASLSKPTSGIDSVRWLGSSGVGMTVKDGNKVELAMKTISVAEVEYRSAYKRFALTLTSLPIDLADDEDYPIVCAFWTEEDA